MSLGQAIWIGSCQILLGGVSRDVALDVDDCGGQLAGMSRASALEFSFFLSIPTMVAATGYDAAQIAEGKRRESHRGFAD